MASNSELLRTPLAARYVGLARSTLEKMRLTGAGPIFIKAGPRIVVYRRCDLDAWLDARRHTSTSEIGPSNPSKGELPNGAAVQ